MQNPNRTPTANSARSRQTLQRKDVAAALLVAFIWGLAFVVTKVGLEVYTPAQLAFMRFLVACIAALWIPRPKVSGWLIVAVGATTFTGQFLLQFYGVAMGMPAGLTAVVSQTQALFTVALSAALLNDKPNRQQLVGLGIALSGLAAVGVGMDRAVPMVAFGAVIASAVSWATGNVLLKRQKNVNMLHLVVWASLVPPLPALTLSLLVDPSSAALWPAGRVPIGYVAVPVYLGVVATVFAYAVWGSLLQRYPAAAVTPFALLAPCAGALMSALLLGERVSTLQLIGGAAILLGALLNVLPGTLLPGFGRRSSAAQPPARSDDGGDEGQR